MESSTTLPNEPVPMKSIQSTIVNKLGLHARAAARLVSLAATFNANIEIEYKGRKVNGKSIMGVMMLAAGKGAVVTLYADGADADDALQHIGLLIAERFEEAE